MHKPIFSKLEKAYLAHPDKQKKEQMEAYMRKQFEYIGIPKPMRAAIEKPFLKELLQFENPDLELISKELWAKKQREFHYFAIIYLEKAHRHWTEDTLALFEYLITTHSWWDSVDTIADHLVGKLLLKYPELIKPAVKRWNESGNLWLQRTAIIFQLKYKEKTDEQLLFDVVKLHSGSKEFFIQKGIGWALRQYRYTNETAVDSFVTAHKLAPLSVREALKHAEK